MVIDVQSLSVTHSIPPLFLFLFNSSENDGCFLQCLWQWVNGHWWRGACGVWDGDPMLFSIKCVGGVGIEFKVILYVYVEMFSCQTVLSCCIKSLCC